MGTIVNKKWTESDIIADAIGERSYRDAAEWLNEKLPVDFQISHASVHNWVEGAYKSSWGFIIALTLFYEIKDARYGLGAALWNKRNQEAEKVAK